MEQCQKIERVTRFGIYFPIRSQPDKAGIPYVPADWGIRGAGVALSGRGTADRKMNCEVDSWEFRL